MPLLIPPVDAALHIQQSCNFLLRPVIVLPEIPNAVKIHGITLFNDTKRRHRLQPYESKEAR